MSNNILDETRVCCLVLINRNRRLFSQGICTVLLYLRTRIDKERFTNTMCKILKLVRDLREFKQVCTKERFDHSFENVNHIFCLQSRLEGEL